MVQLRLVLVQRGIYFNIHESNPTLTLDTPNPPSISHSLTYNPLIQPLLPVILLLLILVVPKFLFFLVSQLYTHTATTVPYVFSYPYFYSYPYF